MVIEIYEDKQPIHEDKDKNSTKMPFEYEIHKPKLHMCVITAKQDTPFQLINHWNDSTVYFHICFYI